VVISTEKSGRVGHPPSIKKSQQRLDNKLKKIKSLQDVTEDID